MLDYTHLEALLAVNKAGSFEAAAKVLGMSPIGVATRIRKLEERIGVSLLLRKPTRPTQAGNILCDFAENVFTLETNLIAEQKSSALQSSCLKQTLRIAINNESQLPWLSKAHGMKSKSTGLPWSLDVTFIDQDHTIQHMRNGSVIAAFSSQKHPVHGFKSHCIGSTEYMAVASPSFFQEHLARDVSLKTLSNTPCIRCSDEDELCYQWLKQSFGKVVALTCFRMPNLYNQIELCLSGTGWAVLPANEIKSYCLSGKLQELISGSSIEKKLYWHIATIMLDDLMPLTKDLRKNYLNFN